GAKSGELASDDYPLPKVRIGALIGRFGDGTPFLIGTGGTFKADRDGVLQLRVNAVADMEKPEGGYVVVAYLPTVTQIPSRAQQLVAPPEIPGKIVYIAFPVSITLDGKLDDWTSVPLTRVDRGS